jgi:hypothetical protein
MLMIKSRMRVDRKIKMKKPTVLTVLLVVVLFVFSGCVSNKYSLKEGDQSKAVSGAYDFDVDISFLNAEQLEQKYGKANNPFIGTPGLFKIMAFEITVTNNTKSSEYAEDEVVIALNSIRLFIYGSMYEPVNQFGLSNYWETKERQDNLRRGDVLGKLKIAVKKYAFPNSIELAVQHSYTGVLVFIERKTITYGEGSIHIPVFTPEGALIGVIKKDFSL